MKKILVLSLLLLPFSVSANTLVDTTVDGFKIKAIKVVKNTWYKIISVSDFSSAVLGYN